jgi:GNAT superfamily N-acetyltransferase
MKIIPYDERYAQDFARLNQEWLEGFGLLEDADAKHLKSPRESIIDRGGQIFFAVEGEAVLGTCAAIRYCGEVAEVAKLAVAHSAKRHGIGRLLVQTVIEDARSIGARKVSLVSSSRLRPALQIYESMGFAYAPLPVETGYVSADIFMELILSGTTPCNSLTKNVCMLLRTR